MSNIARLPGLGIAWTVQLTVFAVAGFAAELPHPTLPIGSLAPEFSLPGVDGKTHKLSDYADSKALVVVFTCNHCPAAQMYDGRIQKLAEDYRDRQVTLVAINSDNPDGIRLDQLGYTDVGDSLYESKIRAEYRQYKFPYLYDADDQTAAQAYGPVAIPHAFVFDEQRKLRYEGRMDDNQRESLVTTHDARNAIDAILTGKPVPVEHTAALGCSITWKQAIPPRLAELKTAEAEPVRLEAAGANEFRQLRRNPTGKMLLVNFWATWCGPCVSELPDLITTWRMYRKRGFEFVTVSTNTQEESPGALKELRMDHASSRNLQFSSDDTAAMQAAFDPTWESGVPFTMLLAPDGKVLYRQEGELDVLELRRIILANLPDSDAPGDRAFWMTKQ
jgi:thiol-disulfide isomerase/thioredoxin